MRLTIGNSRHKTNIRRIFRSRILLGITVALLSLVLCCPGAPAQSGAGSIQGTIQDATRAVIPGVSIRVVNTATGVVSTTKSNNVGFYQVPGLFTGRYRVTVIAPGMKTYTTVIDLLVAQAAVINPVMTPGAVTQQVVVSGNEVQLITPDNGTISDTLENARINQLPMNGRDLTTLTGMTVLGLENGGTTINGLNAEALQYQVDGVTMQNNHDASGDAQVLIDPDSVQEVRTEAVTAGAEYPTPATIMATTKSGTNRLQGTFFWTTRNNAFGIAKSREDPSNFSAPHYIRNEAGASVGGPIVLPHLYHGKNKSFFFFAYERYSLAQSAAVLGEVPTVAMSQGDFSGLVNGAGITQQLYDPSTTYNTSSCPTPATVNGVQEWNGGTPVKNAYCRKPFGNGIGGSSGNNQIPLSEESPLAKLYYQLAPLPTSTANPLVTDNLTALSPSLAIKPQITFRLDHEFNANNLAYLRYTQYLTAVNISGGPRNRAADGIPAGAAVPKAGYFNQPLHNYLVGIGYTHIFSPTFFAETVATQQWLSIWEEPGTFAIPSVRNVDYESQLGLPNNFGTVGFPKIANLIFSFGGGQAANGIQAQVIPTLEENLTKVAGRHQLQFGGRYQYTHQSFQPPWTADTVSNAATPTAIYNPSTGANYTSYANTGYGDASFFLGSASSYSVNLNGPIEHYHLFEIDGYFQDNYHVSKTLTLNLGLRYEAHPALYTDDGLFTSFDYTNDAEVLAAPPATLIAKGYTTQALITNMQNIGVKFETPQQAGMPANTLLKSYNLNFLPRGGIAYQPFGGKHGTVIRGAYGRYINPVPDFNTNQLNNIPLSATYTQSYTTAAQAIDGLPNELLRYNDPVQFGVMGVNTANVVNTNATNSLLPGSSLLSEAPDDAPPTITETNLTVEQQLKGNSALRVSWIWTHSTNLLTRDYPNNHPSTYQWEMATGTALPTGGTPVIGTPQQNTYSTTATGPYDQTTWGNNNLWTRTGWSNDNLLQVNYQRLYHRGLAYQIAYVFSKPMRMGGDTQEALYAEVDPYANFPGATGTIGTMTSPYGVIAPAPAPPAPPKGYPDWEDYHAMDKFQRYSLDSSMPIHHIFFNGVVDLPFGRGKRFFSGVNGFWNEVIGGFHLAGDGSIVSQVFNLTGTYWGPTSPLHIYKHRHPITDCRSGVCYKAYLWFNGYLAPTVTSGVAGSVCTTNCVSGLPSDYQPYQTPIDNDPTSLYYGENEVVVTLSNGKQVTQTYDAGPVGTQYLEKNRFSGPFNYSEDISLFKEFPIHEHMNLRFNVDAFNAFNVQGYNNPSADGVEQVQPGVATSANAPRQIQLTMRLTF